MSSLPVSIKRIGSKTTEKRWRHRFPYYKSMGDFCCHRNQSFKPICPKTLCNLTPTLMMLLIKFDQHWPTGLRDIQVSSELWQNSGRTRQNQYSPPFSKRGYNYLWVLWWCLDMERAQYPTQSHYSAPGWTSTISTTQIWASNTEQPTPFWMSLVSHCLSRSLPWPLAPEANKINQLCYLGHWQ